GKKVSLFLKPSGYEGKRTDFLEPGSNGLLVDGEGNLVLMEHGDRRVSRLAIGKKGAEKTTLADKYEGKRPNSPNDGVFAKNGDPKQAVWMKYPIEKDGSLGKGTVFFDATKWAGTKGKTHDGKPALQLPDGMKVDQKGNLWATGPGGLLIFTAEGKHLGTLVT